VDVELRDVLIKAGILLPEDIPRPDEPTPPSTKNLDLYAVARAYGIPDDKASLFVASVEAVANTFADEQEEATIGGSSQTGRLSARR
jgi:hypothetical protein